MKEARTGDAQRGAEVFLLDVHLERVKENSDVGMPDLVDQADCVRGRIQEGGVEARQRLNGNPHVQALRILRERR